MQADDPEAFANVPGRTGDWARLVYVGEPDLAQQCRQGPGSEQDQMTRRIERSPVAPEEPMVQRAQVGGGDPNDTARGEDAANRLERA